VGDEVKATGNYSFSMTFSNKTGEIFLTMKDRETDQVMTAKITPKQAMHTGDALFKTGANMQALLASREE
jgi:hypothetical protein